VRIVLTLILLLCACAVFGGDKPARPSETKEVFFKGTEYELNVYRIYGRTDGPTMLIVGGIQGDEPGGFLSADLYSSLKLEKGNLIVVPRANFKSIILYDRGPDGDMNRRFQDEKPRDEMDKAVFVIMDLMKEADVFLNLHDGWGYHNPAYIDSQRNPKRFGQSIIADADTYTCADGRVLDLKTPANEVLEKINKKIGDDRYILHYFNTNTENPLTKFADMRKTATYYALRTYCIPAFGIESSKNLPSVELKVLYHNYAVNEFMKYYDIIPEHPSIFIIEPKLRYAVIDLNGELKTVENGETLYVSTGDVVEVTHIEANYDRGLSCDVLGMGDLNDLGEKITVRGESRIIFRRDNNKMGEIKLKLAKTAGASQPEPVKASSPSPSDRVVFNVKLNGADKQVYDGETLSVSKQDIVEFISAGYENDSYKDYPVNVKGYVPPVSTNYGDDRGYEISMSERFMLKYSRDGDGKVYPVIAGNSKNEVGRIWLEIE
jgi:hypothetical protein